MESRRAADHPDNVHVGDRIELQGGQHDGWQGVVIWKTDRGVVVVKMDSGEVVTMVHNPPQEEEK